MSDRTKPWGAKHLLLVGFLTLVALVAGIGTWSVIVEIAGTIVLSGLMELASNRQVVQQTEGGVVSEINVEDGDICRGLSTRADTDLNATITPRSGSKNFRVRPPAVIRPPLLYVLGKSLTLT